MKAGNFLWSVRREVWENRSIYIAPLAIAGLVLFGYAIHSGQHAAGLGKLAGLDARFQAALVIPYGMAASAILVTGWLVGLFYALDALHGERRDRSILFWKSMPVSDLETVLAKLSIPLFVVPFVGMVVVVATQVLMLVIGSVAMAAKGFGAEALWRGLPMATMTLVMLYGVVVHILWFAPIFAWLLLVSGWARRAAFLWAFLPFFAAFAVETIGFGTRHVADLLEYRIVGAMGQAFGPEAMKKPIVELSQLTPGQFLGTPGLWLGLVSAALLVAAAIRLRRYREPI